MTSSSTPPSDRIRGALLGLAWGDVLGCPVEGWDARDIRRVYGVYADLPLAYSRQQLAGASAKTVRRLRPLGLHSDDTQQALALLSVCLSPGGWSADKWAACLVEGMAAGAWRGYGQNFNGAVVHLARGVPPQRAGNRTAGIGAAMRSGPLGALYRDDPAALATAVMESSLTTHGDIRAAAIAYAVAYAAAGFVAGQPAETIAAALPSAVVAAEADWLEGHREWEHDRSGGHAVSLGLSALLADLGAPVEGLRRRISEHARPTLAPGFTRAHPNQGYALLGGAHALVMALRPACEPQAALAEIVQQGYDTDTVAAVAGSLLGARFGCAWVPVARLVDHDRLLAYADALVTRAGLPEDMAGFIQREAALTAAEAAFQAQTLSQPGLIARGGDSPDVE